MKIAFLAHRELASALAVNLVAKRLSDHDVCVFVSGEHGAFGDGTPSVEQLERVEQKLESALDEPPFAAQAERLGLRSLNNLAGRYGQPAQVLAQPNSDVGLQSLRDAEPDLLVSIRYRRILHAEAIAIPRLGVINWHSGLLPEYQGVMATFWAMRNGDAQIGSSLHYIPDRTIDTGPVIARYPIECRYALTYLDNVLRLYLAGAAHVADTVNRIAHSGSAPYQQQDGTAAYYSAPAEDDVRAFHSRGHTLYDGGELDRLLCKLAT